MFHVLESIFEPKVSSSPTYEKGYLGSYLNFIQTLPFHITTIGRFILFCSGTNCEMRKHFIQTVSHENFSSFGIFNVLFHA